MVNVAVGFAVILVAFVGYSRLTRRFGGSVKSTPAGLLLVAIFMSVGFGLLQGGLSYARDGSARQAVLSTVILGPAFGVLMTTIFGLAVGWQWLFRRSKYTFAKAWTRAHFERGAPPPRSLRRGQRRYRIMLEFRDRWEREQPHLTAEDFVALHWEEITAAEAVDRRERPA